MKESIRPVILDRIPTFVKEDYPNFVRFISDYFAWLETDENFLGIINAWKKNTEPSQNVEPYIDAIMRDVGFYFDRTFTVPKSTVLHFLRDFYLSRGSKQSFKLLFQILFNQGVEISYPRDRMLVPSDAEYGERHFVYLSVTDQEIVEQAMLNIKETGGFLEGFTSKVSASIQNISLIAGNGAVYAEVEILLPIGEFIVNEAVKVQVGEISFTEVVKPVAALKINNPGTLYQDGDWITISGCKISGAMWVARASTGGIDGIVIKNPGIGYRVGQSIRARRVLSGGSGFIAQITEVNSTGGVLNFSILNPGYGYRELPELFASRATREGFHFEDVFNDPIRLAATTTTIGQIKAIGCSAPYVDFDTAAAKIITSNGVGADLEVVAVSRFTLRSWETRRGFLGENCTLIDSDRFQQFSYEITSSVNPKRYIDIVDELLHPVGFVRTPIVALESTASIGSIGSDFDIQRPVTLEFNHSYPFEFDHTLVIEEIDLGNVILTGSGETIVTSSGDNIIWTVEEDNYIVTHEGDEIVTENDENISIY